MPPSSPAAVAGHHLSRPRSSPADPFSTNTKTGASIASLHTRSAANKRRQQPVAQLLFPKASSQKSNLNGRHSRSAAPPSQDAPFSGSKRSSSASRSAAGVTDVHEASLPHPPRRYSTADVKGILSTAYPGRARQVDELLGMIGGAGDPAAPILVYGGAATGKTTLVRDTMRLLGRPHAFVSCRSSYNARLLFESVLNQLLGHVRCSANGFASAKRCDRISDFVTELPSACAGAIARNRHSSSGQDAAPPPPPLPSTDSASGNVGDDPVVVTTSTSSRPSSPILESCCGDIAAGEVPLSQQSSADAPTGTSSNPPSSSVSAVEDSSGNVRGSSASTTDSAYGCSSNEQLSQMSSAPQSESVFLVFDNVELLRNWTNGHDIISALLRISELARLPMLGVILISKVGWDSFRSCTGARDPLPIYFSDYSDDELCQILLQRHHYSSLYSSFLSVVIKPFSRACKRLTELGEALELLYKKYREPVISGQVKPDEEGKRRLYQLVVPHIRQALSDAVAVAECSSLIKIGEGGNSSPSKELGGKRPCPDGAAVGMRVATTDRSKSVKAGHSGELGKLDFELSYCSKFLMIAAYIASRNPPTLDSTLFGAAEEPSARKRRRVLKAEEKQELAVKEKQMRGPSAFALERLLAIFKCIVEMNLDQNSVWGRENLSGLARGCPDGRLSDGGMELSADVFMQISTLVATNLLSKSGSDPLDSRAHYRCNIDEDLIKKVAVDVKFPLHRYLFYG